jgi:hypothetical protein
VLGRLGSHALQILFFGLLEAAVKWILHLTGQEHEWWAVAALWGSGAMFLISFLVIGGSELVGDCASALRWMVRRIRGE